MTTEQYRGVVATLRKELQPLVDGLDSSESPIAPCLTGRPFPARRIEALAARFAEHVGLERTWTRFVPGLAPVSSPVGPGDIRITTRCEENELLHALILTAHEAGHAFYRHALNARPFGDPLNEPASVSIDEAHARLWEAIIVKLPEFWVRAYPVVNRHFRRALCDVSLEQFVGATRYAVRGGMRARTDDLTYCLYNDVQAEIEIALLDGSLRGADVPEEFDRRIMAMLGAKPHLLRSALSNIHWPANLFGRFPTYTLGSVFAGQFWAAMTREIPDLLSRIARRDFDTIHSWLWENVQRHGRLLLPDELMVQATGVALNPGPWIDIMWQRYG